MPDEQLPVASDDIAPDIAARSALREQERLLQTLRERAGGAPPDAPRPGDMPPPEPPDARGGVAASLSIPADVIKGGAVQAPRAVARGVLSGLVEAAKTGREATAAWPVPPKVAAALGEVDLDAVAELIPPPETQTGKMIAGVAQFLTGFVAAGRMLKPWAAAGRAARTGKAMAQGAVSDFAFFDAAEPGLSNLIESQPELANPVTAFLATDPDDEPATNRLKRTLEGLGLGAATDGFVAALKTMRRAVKARAAARNAASATPARPDPAALEQSIGEQIDADWAALGYDPDAPLVQLRRRETRDQAIRAEQRPLDADATYGEDIVRAEGLAPPRPRPAVAPAKEGGDAVIVNHLRINAPDDVHDAIQQIAEARKGQLDVARRGVRSWDDTRQAAGERDAWADLMDQRAQRGEAIPTAERQLAMRELWISSAEKLTEAAEIAAKSPTPGNRFAFRRLLATHHAIQSEVIAARTETARALNQWRMPAGATRERLRAIEDALAETGGAETHDQLARAIAAFRGREGEYARAIDAVARQGWLARGRDAALSIWINALLSGPKTHIANMISNTSVLGLAQIERRVGEGISSALDSADGVAAGEAVAQYHGMVEGLKDLFRLSGDSSFWRYLKGEVKAPGPEKIERTSKGAVDPLSAEAWGVAANTTPGRVIDFLSGAVKLPGSALEAEDFLFKSLNYRMELHAQALRQATREVQAGAIPAERLKERMATLISDPPEHIRLDATEAALVNTFTSRPGWFGQSVMRTVSQGPALRIIMPFVRTPVNLFRFTAERSPAAPLVRQWRADIAAGGARRDLALARLATGTAIMMVALDMAQNGLITGRAPSSPGEREMFFRDGKKEYAVKMGDRWVQVSRMDPLGTTLGIAGDLAATFAGDFDEDYDEDASRAVTAAIFAAAYNATSKTYLSGLSGLMRGAIYGGEAAENEIKSFVGTLVPTVGAEVARALDPVLRDAADLTDGLVRRTPWASEHLPKQRDLWGREVSLQSGLGQAYDVLSPAYSSREDAAPIDRELRALGYFPSKPGRRVVFPAGWNDTVGIDLRSFDPQLYWRYVELAGNGLKHPVWDLGLFDLANQIVTGKHDLTEAYRARPADRRAAFWQNLIADYRDRARKQLIDESPELRREIAERHRARRADLLGEVP
jgi:hypothetical protein